MVKLSQYSQGNGCGNKIPAMVLDTILQTAPVQSSDNRLIVDYQTRDDAAVVDVGNGMGIVSATNFLLPVVDSPFDFGKVAAANALSSIYAMGAKPIMALATLGWPIHVLAAEIAGQVVAGGREICHQAGIALAGGHSIDSPEPIFGLSLTGSVSLKHLKRNNQATEGCRLFLTKPLGTGILMTAQKQDLLPPEHHQHLLEHMLQLNTAGLAFGALEGVKAMTDIGGNGLLGHLIEVCEGSAVSAVIEEKALPLMPWVEDYRQQGCIPGSTNRNFDCFSDKTTPLTDRQKQLLCDPQVSGGLLVAVCEEALPSFFDCAAGLGMCLEPIGELKPFDGTFSVVIV